MSIGGLLLRGIGGHLGRSSDEPFDLGPVRVDMIEPFGLNAVNFAVNSIEPFGLNGNVGVDSIEPFGLSPNLRVDSIERFNILDPSSGGFFAPGVVASPKLGHWTRE